jgi:predicted transcriptional regulator
MQKTKLEIYVCILKIINQNGSFETGHVVDALNISTNELNSYLAFLLKQGFVEESKVENDRLVFLITHRGIRVLEHFKELKQKLPTIGTYDHKVTHSL